MPARAAGHRPGGLPARTALDVKQAEADTGGVMVCLVPPEEVTKVLVDLDETTEPAEQAHITLLYLGSTEQVGGALGRERLYRAVYDFAINSGYRGLTGRLNGFGTFSNPDSNVLIGLWDIPGIAEFRTHLADYCRRHGVGMRRDDHGFTPHHTLAYSDDPITSLPRLPDNLPDRVVFGGVTISWADEWQTIELP